MLVKDWPADLEPDFLEGLGGTVGAAKALADSWPFCQLHQDTLSRCRREKSPC